jgi:hypothetical protein
MAINFSKLNGVPTNKSDAVALAQRAEALSGQMKVLMKEHKAKIAFKESELGLALLAHVSTRKSPRATRRM